MKKVINMMKKQTLLAVAPALLVACGSGERNQEQANTENVGTSPLTNCSFDSPTPGETFDVAIINGRVMDPECNFDGVRNVGIKGNRIAMITKGEVKGKKTIDAKGLVVAPGFINTHSHSFSPFEQRMMAHDGTTTILDTELGVSNIDIFYDKYKDNSLLNYGVGISHEEVRRVVMDGLMQEETSDPTYILKSRNLAEKKNSRNWSLSIATPNQHEEILKMYDKGMRDGAISVNSTVGYMGYSVPTYELFDLQKMAKKYDRFFGAHTRYGTIESLPNNYSLGVREIIANSVALDGALIVSHMQSQNWPETYELCQRFQEKGQVMFCEYYPSIYGTPNIATPQLLPDKIKLNNGDPTKMIIDPRTGKYFESWEAFYTLQKEKPGEMVFIEMRDKEWVSQWVHMKDIALANDVVTYITPEGKVLPEDADPSEYGGHPRNARTYSYIFRLAREEGLPLMHTVYNASYTPAKYFSRVGLLQERGRLQPGMIADITIFHPEKIADAATLKIGERGFFSKGIPYVMVNGTLVVNNGKNTLGLRPGEAIRYDVITEGEVSTDLNDKQYQWHADLPGYDESRHTYPKPKPTDHQH